MRIRLVAVGAFVIAAVLSAADLTGKWTGTFSEHEGDGKGALLILKQNGSELTGTAGPDEQEQMPIENGKVDGDKVTFEIQAKGLMHFELTLSGKRLAGTVSGEHDGEKRTAKLDVTKSD